MPSPLNEDYKHIMESVPGLYLILDPQLTIVGVSDAYLKATMTVREKITGKYLFDVFPDNPDDYKATGATNLRTSLEIVIRDKKAHTMHTQKYDIRRPDGSFELRYWSPVNTPVLNKKNEVSWIIHQVEDVTEMVLMKKEELLQSQQFEEKIVQLNIELREELKQRTDELMSIFDRITDGFLALDKNFCYVYANKKIKELTNRDPVTLIGKNVWQEFPQAVGTPTYHAFVTAMKEQRYMTNIDYFEPLDLWQENHIYPSSQGLSVFIRDITVQKKAETRIKQSRDELRQLASHLQNVREEEQRRIAREVHDELGQLITGITMDVSWIKKKVATQPGLEPIALKLEEISALLDSSVNTVRKISSELRPAILDDMGVVAALEWQTNIFEKRFSIPVKFSSTRSAFAVSRDLATGLFRMYQESLTNIARHANAKKVIASLNFEENQLVLTITDDGKGFDPVQARERKSLGLLGMRERALMMDGVLDIRSSPGAGTTVIVSVPFVAINQSGSNKSSG